MSNSPESSIQFSCPQCGAALKVGVSMAGNEVKCPKCDLVSRVPRQSVAAGVADEQAAAAPADAPASDPQQPPTEEQQRPPAPVAPAPSLSELAKQRVSGNTDERKRWTRVDRERSWLGKNAVRANPRQDTRLRFWTDPIYR